MNLRSESSADGVTRAGRARGEPATHGSGTQPAASRAARERLVRRDRRVLAFVVAMRATKWRSAGDLRAGFRTR
jgi:hypothetical protein